MLGFAISFMGLVSRYIGTWLSAAILIVGIVLFEPLRLQWIIPWTSTLAATLMMFAIFLLDRFFRFRSDGGWSLRSSAANALCFGATLGALAVTRMADFVIMAPVGLAYAFFVGRDLILGSGKLWMAVVTVIAGASGFLFFIIGLFLFNYKVYGGLFGGPYFATADSFGFFPSILPEKVYSQIIDSFPLYGEAGQDWLSNIPVFTLTLAFLPALFIAPVPRIFKLIAVTIVFQLGLYYSYSDIVPTGTFRYYNIHYFKWMMPLLLVSVVLILQGVWRRSEASRGYAGALATAGGIIVIATGVGLFHQRIPVKVLEQSDHQVVFALSQEKLDFIDIGATSDNWNAIYFAKGFTVTVDGKLLRYPRDYHPYPIPTGMRLLFVRPVSGNRLVVNIGTEVQFTQHLDGKGGWSRRIVRSEMEVTRAPIESCRYR